MSWRDELDQRMAREQQYEDPEYAQTNGHANGKSHQAGDPHMGDGLTEADGAGEWMLAIEMSNPRRYWLRSPIWEKSVDLQASGGYILLTKRQLMSWQALRLEAMDQSGVYVRPDRPKRPVWDGRIGPRLCRRLLLAAERREASPDFDRVLSAIEWIIEHARRAGVPATAEKREAMIGNRPSIVMEDGAVLFKLRGMTSIAKKESVGVEADDIREAANRYGELYWPESRGRRVRYYRIGKEKLQEIDDELSKKDKSRQNATPPAESG